MYLTKKRLGKNSTRIAENVYRLKVGKLSTNLASLSVHRYIEEPAHYFKA